MNENEEWITVCSVAELQPETPLLVQCNGEPVCLYKLEDGVFATHDICTHGMASLSEGYMEEGRIECPLHQGAFDIRTGKAVVAPCTRNLATYPVRLHGDQVQVANARQA